MRIAIAGSGQLAFGLFRSLLESSHEVVALVQNGRLTRGWKRPLLTGGSFVFAGASSNLGLAMTNRIPIIWISRMDEVELAPLREIEPDILLVGGFGVILKAPLLSLPRVGCLNTHSSLLPKHRGPNPFSAVLMADERETGVTFHVMDEGIDTGNILEQHAFPIGEQDTALTVYYKACDLAGRRVVELMDRVEREGLRGTPQDESAAGYDAKLTGEDAYIDWGLPAREIERRARACKPFHVPRFRHHGRILYVTRMTWDGQPVDAAPGTVVGLKPNVGIATGCGTISILVAYSLRPVPWSWPSPWRHPALGDVVS